MVIYICMLQNVMSLELARKSIFQSIFAHVDFIAYLFKEMSLDSLFVSKFFSIHASMISLASNTFMPRIYILRTLRALDLLTRKTFFCIQFVEIVTFTIFFYVEFLITGICPLIIKNTTHTYARTHADNKNSAKYK